VGADVLLREPPAGGLAIAHENTLLLPRREAGGRLLVGLGQRQVDDVVLGLSGELSSSLQPDDVVRRRDERVEQARDSRVVAERAERPYDCHGTDRTNRAASLPPRLPVRATTGEPSIQTRRPCCRSSAASAASTPSPTTTTRRTTRAPQRRRSVRSRRRSGMSRRLRPTTSTCSDGTTAMTAAVGIRRTWRRLVRTSSSEGACRFPSARTRSTVPWPPPASEKPTQLASQ